MLSALKKYKWLLLSIFVLSGVVNWLSLLFPKKVGAYIDAYGTGTYSMHAALINLGTLATFIFVMACIQFALSTYTSELIAKDYRNQLIQKIKNQTFPYIRTITGGRLITTLTSDVDAVKSLIANGYVQILMAVITIIGAVYFLISINWKLALFTLSIIPFVVLVFVLIFKKVGPLFKQGQDNLDNINKVINETIIAAPLIRILFSQKTQAAVFEKVNKLSSTIQRTVIYYFASLIPILIILSNISILVILWFGGKQVQFGTLTLGDMSAFLSYTSVFIWPFFVISFSASFISRANVSYARIKEVLDAPIENNRIEPKSSAALFAPIKGDIVFKNVNLTVGEKQILKNISFEIKAGTKTAVVGPTGAGKTELFYLIAGLSFPTSGEILIDGKNIREWDQEVLLTYMGLVFQDSIIFNTSLKENILLAGEHVHKKAEKVDAKELLSNALATAELNDLVSSLPKGLDSLISERGTTLSGGQKQRVMLARALSIKPSILLLDDFTARVDISTEARIIQNLDKFYPSLTLVSITQKIEPIKKYDHIIVLMEGELVAQGTHDQLIKTSLEYQQINASQQSTEKPH